MNVCLLSLLILSGARNKASRIAPAQKRDHVDHFQEIKVGEKTSGVITPSKNLERLQNLSSTFSVYIEQFTS